MRLRKRLILVSLISVLLSVFVSAVKISTDFTFSRELRATQFSRDLLEGIFELHVITTDLVVHGGERPLQQWEQRYASVQSLLREDMFTDPEAHEILQTIRLRYGAIAETFRQIADFQRNPRGTETDGNLEILIDELSVRMQEIVSDTFSLLRQSRERMDQARAISAATSVLLVFGLLGIALSATIYAYFSIVLSIERLTRRSSTMAKGNLDVEFPDGLTRRPDEIGDLTRTLQSMARKLQGSQMILIREAERTEEARAQTEAVLLSIREGIVLTDREGRIIFVNHPFELLFGWEEPEVIGHRAPDLIPKHDAEGNRVSEEEWRLTRVLAGQEVPEDEISKIAYFARKDGSLFPALVSLASVRRDEGDVLGAVLVFRDVTREVQIDRAKSEFISLTSHQLRTPVTAVRWVMEHLLRPESGLDPEQRLFVQEAYTHARRMAELIDTMLMLSRIDAGALKLTITPVNLRIIAEDVFKELQAEYAKKKQTLRMTGADAAVVQTDARMVREILSNLLSNAVRYSPPGEEIEVRLTTSLEGASVSVVDRGIGIPKDQRERIFEKFFRAANTTQTSGDGTGLGLHLVYALTLLLGGAISFESEEGRGTTFTLFLPWNHEQKEAENTDR